MATYNLSGQGIQTLTVRTTQLQVTVTVLGSGYSIGEAFPANYFRIGSIRIGSGGFYGRPQYIDALECLILVPDNSDTFGYALLSGSHISVTEV
jgi:hypothetical protein